MRLRGERGSVFGCFTKGGEWHTVASEADDDDGEEELHGADDEED